MRKLRPAVVVNLDSIGRLPLRIVVPLTDWQPAFAAFPWFVPVAATGKTGLSKDSGADSFQVKSVSENRFVQRIGNVTNDQLDEIEAAIALCAGAS
jgi:mRNA interferase MazF